MKNTGFKLGYIILLTVIILLNTVACNSTISNSGELEIDNTEDLDLEEQEDQVVIRLAGGDYGLPSPYLHYPRGPGGYKMQLVFDSLLEKDEKGLIPWMAKDWEISEDGLEYIFTINDNIYWHDGEPLKMEDIKFSFEYFEKHPPAWNPVTIDGKTIVDKIEILDENKIKFIMTEKKATALEVLGYARILPKHIWEEVEDPQAFDTDQALIGCGPYQLKSYNKEHGSYEFVAFKEYWGPKQRVDKIQYLPISDKVLAFENNEIDLIEVGTDLLGRYENNSQFNISENPGFWGYRIIFNMEREPIFKEKEVRQGIAHGIDQEEMIEKVARGAAIIASPGYLPKDHIWYNSKVKSYPFDIELAREKLGNKVYSFELLIGNSNDEVRIAELMKISLEKAGVQINIKSIDSKARDSAINSGDYEIVLTGHGGWGSDADILRGRYASSKSDGKSASGNTILGYENQEIQTLAQQQLRELDINKRKDMIFELQELIAEEIPFLPLYNTTGHMVYSPNKYDGWMYMYDHHSLDHSKLSYLQRK